MTLSENAKKFAEACFDQNSIESLKATVTEQPDETDCAEWGITGEEWTAAIHWALSERLEWEGLS
jgi:hypothetical protein